MSEVRQLLGAYALGALDPNERDSVEALLDRSPDARAELTRYNQVVDHLGAMVAANPPGDLWNRIAAQVDRSDTVEPPPRAAGPDARPARGRPSTVTALAAAIAVLLAVGLTVQTRRVTDLHDTLATQTRQTDDLTTELAAQGVRIGALNDTVSVQMRQVDDLSTTLAAREAELAGMTAAAAADPLTRAAQLAAADEDARQVRLSEPDGAAALVTIVLLEDGRGYLTYSELAPLDAARTYQLWAVMADGRVVSAAVLGNDPGADTFTVDLRGLVALAITVEVRGGVVASQNDAVAVGSVDA